jgi:putative transposase
MPDADPGKNPAPRTSSRKCATARRRRVRWLRWPRAMPRSPRLEYPGAHYHVTSRGVRQGVIFVDDRDRASLLAILTRALQICEAQIFAFCLMGNHCHLVLHTRQANLSRLMHRVNSIYSLTFNRRHGRLGPAFEGRFKALHVDRDSYLLEVCRYVDLNPVRAGLVDSPAQWAWSSYRAHIGCIPSPPWLATAELHGALMGQVPGDAEQTASARRRYADWVDAGRGARCGKSRFVTGFIWAMKRLSRT